MKKITLHSQILRLSVAVASMISLTALANLKSACPHLVAGWENHSSCYCQGVSNGTPCLCIQYSSQPAPPGPEDVWQTHGDRCLSSEYSGTDCVRQGYARLYKRAAYGTCQNGACIPESYGDWVYYGMKPYYKTVRC